MKPINDFAEKHLIELMTYVRSRGFLISTKLLETGSLYVEIKTKEQNETIVKLRFSRHRTARNFGSRKQDDCSVPHLSLPAFISIQRVKSLVDVYMKVHS